MKATKTLRQRIRRYRLLVPLLVLIFWIGLYPSPFFNLMEASVAKLVGTIQVAAMAGLP